MNVFFQFVVIITG